MDTPDINGVDPIDEDLRSCENVSSAGDFAAAIALAERIRAQALAEGRLLDAGRAAHLLAYGLLRIGQSDNAVSFVHTALPEVDALPLAEQSIRLRTTLSRALINTGEPVLAMRAATEALARARAPGSPGLVAWCLNSLATAYEALGQRPRAVELLRQACEAVDGVDGAEVRFASFANLAATLTRAVRRDMELSGQLQCGTEARADLLLAVSSVRSAAVLVEQQPHRLLACLEIECLALHALGELQAMGTALERYHVLATRHALIEAQAEGQLLRADWLLASGHAQAACEVLDSSVDRAAAGRSHIVRRWWWTTCHRVYKAAGRLADAMGALESLMAQERADFQRGIASQTGALLREVEVQAALQEADRMRRRAELATQASLRDMLTGLPNRRALDALLCDELGRIERRSTHRLALAMIDVDHFKHVNDHYGHDVGDAVLRELARLLSVITDERNFMARNGGEEFVAVFRGAALRDAWVVCERLRTRVQAHDWSALVPGRQVTVSVGLAAFTPPDDAVTLMRRADKAMYEAKHHGRNRVVCTDR